MEEGRNPSGGTEERSGGPRRGKEPTTGQKPSIDFNNERINLAILRDFIALEDSEKLEYIMYVVLSSRSQEIRPQSEAGSGKKDRGGSRAANSRRDGKGSCPNNEKQNVGSFKDAVQNSKPSQASSRAYIVDLVEETTTVYQENSMVGTHLQTLLQMVIIGRFN
ncbi:hypothetical protein KI387_000857, partial [Taxus chinensis]